MTATGRRAARARRAAARVRPRAARRRRAGRPRTAPRPSSRPPRCVGARRPAGRRTGPAGPRCARGPDDLAATTRSSTAWFGAREALPRAVPRGRSRREPQRSPLPTPRTRRRARATGRRGRCRAAASAAEVLRHRDVADADRRARRAGCAGCSPRCGRAPPRRGARRRHRPGTAARSTPRRTAARRRCAAVGEPGRLALPAPRAPGRAGSCCWSTSRGSMSAVRRRAAAVRARRRAGAGRASHRGVHPRHPADPGHPRDAACATPSGRWSRAGETVPDWSGGTRLGETLQGVPRPLGRSAAWPAGAVVVVFSDGWERGDAALLGEQMARLHRLAHRVVWVNPHRGKAGYAAAASRASSRRCPYCRRLRRRALAGDVRTSWWR